LASSNLALRFTTSCGPDRSLRVDFDGNTLWINDAFAITFLFVPIV
jgi:hypothetical protein